MQRTLITGAAGFIGRHLVDAFADRGDEVIAVNVTGKAWRPDVRFASADIRDSTRMAELCERVDCVVQNASLVHTRRSHTQLVWEVNYGGSQSVLAACRARGVHKLVYISSASAVYGGADIENGDESLPYPTRSQAPYADSKIAAEREILAADRAGSLRTCALRPHVVFGPGDRRFLPAVLSRARAGRLRLGVASRGKLSDFTFVSNLVDAALAADQRLGGEAAVAAQAYFITNGEPIGFFDFVNRLLAELELPRIRPLVPYPLAYSAAALAEMIDGLAGGRVGEEGRLSRFAVRYLCTHHYFSIDKARRELGYQPRVSLAEGIARTAAHVREQGWN